MRRWQLQDAKAKFSAFLNASLTEGPQVVTKRGLEAAVLVRIDHWRALQAERGPGLKELLLAPTPTMDDLAPSRAERRHRSPPSFD